MRHYEIVLIARSDKADSITGITDEYKKVITADGGKVHRCEKSPKRQLAYSIEGASYAYYLITNIEVAADTLKKIEDSLRFKWNTTIIRSLITVQKAAVTCESPLMKKDDYTADEADKKSTKKSSGENA